MKKQYISSLLALSLVISFLFFQTSPVLADSIVKYTQTGTAGGIGGGADWNNAGNITADDDTDATFDAYDQTTNFLRASNFGFSIPDSATIDGIIVNIEKFSDNGITSDYNVNLIQSGTATGTNKSIGGFWGATRSSYEYGSISDTWGVALTPNIINSSSFGVELKALISQDADAGGIDYFTMTVYYSVEGETPVNDLILIDWTQLMITAGILIFLKSFEITIKLFRSNDY